MEITQENPDALNAIIKVKITERDYQPQVDKALKEAAKKMTMPGFRPGTVPVAMVKKTHGRYILLEVLNKLINGQLSNHLVSNKLQVLGQPLPKADDVIDIEKGGNLYFTYEVGIAPQIEVNFANVAPANYYTVKVDEDLLNKYKNDVSRRNGKYESPDTVGANDLVYIDLVELDADGGVKVGGIFQQSTLAVDMINSEAFKAELIGKTKDEVVKANAKDLASSSIDLASMLNMDKAAAEQVTSDFNVKIGTISRVMPAELNQDFYTQMYGEGVVNNEAEFNAKITEELAGMFSNDSDRRLRYEIQSQLINTINPNLPDAFLKRWILESNTKEKQVTPEQIEKEYPNYAKSLKAQLIEGKIMNEYKISLDKNELLSVTKQLVRDQYFKNSTEKVEDSFLTETANKILEKEEEYRRVADMVLDRKLVALYKEKFQLTTTELSYNDFVKKMNEE